MTSNKLIPILGLVALVGCGRIESTPEEAIGDGPVAAPEAPAAPPATSVPAPARRTGYISMTSGGGAFHAYADFPIASTPLAPGRSADCEIMAPGRDVAASESAGKIVIDLPSRGQPASATLAFDAAKKSYEPAMLDADGKDERVEKANAPFHIRAAGAGVPAFDVDVPSAFDARLIEPAEGSAISDKTGDLVVRWSDGGNEVVFVILNGADTSVSCRFPAAAGQGVIPTALVQKVLLASAAATCLGGCVSIGLSSLRTSKVSAGDYDISVTHALTSFRRLRDE